MRRSALALALLVAACARTPEPEAQVTTPVTPSPHIRSGLLGMTASQLIATLGNPQFQVREGPSLKVQFRSDACILDAYLYPQGGSGELRVTHVDARLPSGADTNQAACISALEGSS